MKKTTLILILTLLSSLLFSNSDANNQQIIDSLKHYELKLVKGVPLDVQAHANRNIIRNLRILLKQSNSIELNFDTLTIISVLTSDDKKVRVFTWTKPEPLGMFSFYGIVQTYNEKLKKFQFAMLENKDLDDKIAMKKNLPADRWYGARYYDIIMKKSSGKTYYTLLGWKSVDMALHAKVVDVLILKNNGDFNFGYNLFDMRGNDYFKSNSRPKRLIFKYSHQGTMTLKYQKQTILKKVRDGQVKRSPKQFGFSAQKKDVRSEPKYKKIRGKMIVFDQMAPENPNLEGIFSYYIPKINVLDALYFDRGKWVYYPDIDARNPTPGNERKPVINYDLIETIEEED